MKLKHRELTFLKGLPTIILVLTFIVLVLMANS